MLFQLLQDAINGAVAEGVDRLSDDSAWKKCTQRAFQSVALIIDKANVSASGDIRVMQKARAALACAQSANLSSEQIKQVENSVVARVDDVLRAQKTPLTKSTIRASVAPALSRAINSCAREEKQGVAVAPTIRFGSGTTIIVGCLQSKFDRLASECEAALASGANGKHPSCVALADCLRKRGNIDIVADFTETDACAALDDLALDIASLAIAQNAPSEGKGETSQPDSWPAWLWPTVGASMLFIVVLLLAALSVAAARRQRQPMYLQPPYYPAKAYAAAPYARNPAYAYAQ